MKRILFSIMILFLWCNYAKATHNRAGEITYTQIGDLSIRIKITTYTQTNSVAADRDSLLVFWGDGTSEYVYRTNGNGEGVPLPNNIKLNEYEAEHSYPGQATYTVGFMDRNRVGNILNVNAPNSIEVPFYVQTTFTFLSSQTNGVNNSAILLQPPVDVACVNEVFIHNPGAYDIDGDSLAYELGIPAMASNMNVPLYQFPDEIGAGADNQISIDPVTGDFVWDSPKLLGQYNIAILIKEYRKGVLINTIVRDMQIRVNNCTKDDMSNQPPVIEGPDEICVVAGEVIDIDFDITDPNIDAEVELSANGGPFVVDTSAAVFTTDGNGYLPTPRQANFRWETNCQHISRYGYQIVIKAEDLFCDVPSLTTLKTIQIKVVGPPPENLTTEAVEGNIQLEWDFPYTCMNTANNFFRGFSIWRKTSSEFIEQDTCSPGLSNSGYEKIVFLTRANNGIKYRYLDTEVDRGTTYCYRVQAEFAQETASGQLFNIVESLPSNESCEQLSRDLPLLTKVSVDRTNFTAGEISIEYIRPLPDQLDTLENPGPYRYELWRSINDLNNFQRIDAATQTAPNFFSPIDLSFTDQLLNTEEPSYYYRVDFYVGNSSAIYGESLPAENPFLTAQSLDRAVELTLRADVPWNNFQYIIERLNPQTLSFEVIDSVSEPFYIDEGLENEVQYCYRIKTIGNYGLEQTPSPLINYSNERCAIPQDNVPPCPPELNVTSICDEDVSEIDLENLINTLNWINPDDPCNEVMDIVGYRIYYAALQGEEKTLLEEIDQENIRAYDHRLSGSINGCYEVTAIDPNGNESAPSNEVCIDNCPAYVLPNTFTPNDDSFNDLYVPRVNRFIESVEFNVFNRWGNKVFTTTDPAIKWNGQNLNGDDLNEGVYYYTCRVIESRVFGSGERPKLLRGDIHLIRGN